MTNRSLSSAVVLVQLVVKFGSHAAIVFVIPIDSQPPPHVVAAFVVVVVVTSFNIEGGGGHEFAVVSSQSSRPIPRMIHSVHERDLSRMMNLCWLHIKTHRVSVGYWLYRGRMNPLEI